MGTIRIGISGWSYDDWRGSFYSDDLPHYRELEHATGVFDTLEINGTLYSLTTPHACREWYQAAPRGFVYAVKEAVSSPTTRSWRTSTERWPTGILELREKLGPILWQLPGEVEVRCGEGRPVPGNAPPGHRRGPESGPQTRRPCGAGRQRGRRQPPHASRLRAPPRDPPAARDGADRKTTRSRPRLSHSSEWLYVEEITAGFVYVRLRGPKRVYDSAYGKDSLRRWAGRISAWHSGAQADQPTRISDLQPPSRKERDVYLYFDNTASGQAPKEALALRDLLEES